MAAAHAFAAAAGAAVVALAALGSGPPRAPEPPRPPGLETAAAPARQLIPVEILRVVDGDTVEVKARVWLDQWIVTRVRLRGIDAPERQARCAAEAERGEAARRHLVALAGEGQAFLADLGRDKYGGRVLGRLVGPDGRDIGGRMLADGHARTYDGRRRQGWC